MSREENSQFENISSGLQNIGQRINENIGNVREGINESMNEFSQQTQAGIGATSQFLQSNTLIAKFAFFLLILILFLVVLALGIMFLNYIFSPPENPYLIKGMIDGTYSMVITQDPSISSSTFIQKSINQYSGAEFTWSFWINVKSITPIKEGNVIAQKYLNVFNKGDTRYDTKTGLASVNNAPGVYLNYATTDGTTAGQNSCALVVIMDTVNTTSNNSYESSTGVTTINDQNTVINNIPIRKWVHVAIRLQNTFLDIYINGTVDKRITLPNVPKQNYDNVNICNNGGFNGQLSNLRYYNYALNVFEINSIVSWGPNLSAVDSTASNGYFQYLGRDWYSYR